METREIIDRLLEGRLSRRACASALAAAGVGLVVHPLTARRAGAAEEITYFTWAEYEKPDFHQDYIKKYGGSPAISIFGDEEEALQKIRGGYRPDVAHPCSYMVSRWHDAGVVKPLDVSRIEH